MSEALAGGAAFPGSALSRTHDRARVCFSLLLLLLLLLWCVCVWCLCLVSRVGIAEEEEEEEEEAGEEFHGFVLRSFQGVPVVSSGQLHACMYGCLLA